jgi:hypothetical protein
MAGDIAVDLCARELSFPLLDRRLIEQKFALVPDDRRFFDWSAVS